MLEKVNEILADESAKMAGFKDTGNGFVRYDKQVSTIHAISKKMNWKRAKLFNYILKSFKDDELKNRLTEKEIKYHNLSAVYKLLDVSQKRLIIQRMDLMKNKYNGNKPQN